MKALKILFADDDLKYSMLLKRFLEKEGYEVTYAGNGKIALEQFPLIKPDLVLLDINMPGYNGFEVAERIRETDKHVLIFFLSDRSDKADRLQGFQLKRTIILPNLSIRKSLRRVSASVSLRSCPAWQRMRCMLSAIPYSITVRTRFVREIVRC